MRKKFFTALLTTATMLSTLPVNAFAAENTFSPKDGDKMTVVASASVTKNDLTELGLDLIVSIPTELSLAMDGNGNFTGSNEIYAYGVMGEGEALSVSIDETYEDYLKILYRKTPEDSSAVFSDTNFNGTVKESLSRTSFTGIQTAQNYLDKKNGSNFTYTSALSVEIKGLLPYLGAGQYFTRVPLIIRLR